ncbi:hypothetical protein J1TS3_04380 [Siminovitchia fordii]|uniref:Uncharacterized protein n=1 Tax=Siminovitchia fordii TaxID=254759 RepID=A0ABQ4K0N6_9BACI|nr:hypothetical protein J1TS3_04380 [Siminovitchia fordii]
MDIRKTGQRNREYLGKAGSRFNDFSCLRSETLIFTNFLYAWPNVSAAQTILKEG